eukprot:scaffold2134_cov182-Alexandrium_tamarense.AAC.1
MASGAEHDERSHATNQPPTREAPDLRTLPDNTCADADVDESVLIPEIVSRCCVDWPRKLRRSFDMESDDDDDDDDDGARAVAKASTLPREDVTIATAKERTETIVVQMVAVWRCFAVFVVWRTSSWRRLVM